MSSPSVPPKTPSAAEMVALLSSDEMEAPPKAPREMVALPRPRWWLRLITLACLILLACMGLATAVASMALDSVVEGVFEMRRQQAQKTLVTLPPADILLDDAAYAEALQRYDGEAHRIIAARLSLQNSPAAIEKTCRMAASVIETRPYFILVWAEALCALGRTQEARACIERLAGQRLEEQLATRLAQLVEKTYLATDLAR